MILSVEWVGGGGWGGVGGDENQRQENYDKAEGRFHNGEKEEKDRKRKYRKKTFEPRKI